MARITASLVVNFTDNADTDTGSGLVLEIDDRDDGLNNGNTSFRPGDSAYYLLYTANDVTVKLHGVTAGTRSSAGSGAREVDEILTFTDNDEASLQYPTSSVVTMDWLGYLRTDDKTDAITKQVINQQTVRLSGKVAGFLRCRYTANYDAYKLSNVPTDLEQSMVFVIGERADG